MKFVFLLIAQIAFGTTFAYADQIDYFLKFSSEATAIADVEAAKFRISALWDASQVFTGLQVWRASQDVPGPDSIDLSGVHYPTMVHKILPGWWVMVSLNRVYPALLNHSVVQLVVDRDKANAKQTGAIVKSVVGQVILQDIRISPVPAGADYMFGSWQ